MNLTFHIIKKDIRRMGWALAVWAACGLYLVIGAKLSTIDGSIADRLKILSVMIYMIMSLALIVGIVQEDGLTESDVFWRTRPTSSARMITAKLSLLLPLFVLLPVLVVAVTKPAASTLTARDFGYMGLSYLGVTLAFAAFASCSKDLVRGITLGVLSVVVCAILGAWLERFGAPLPRGVRLPAQDARAIAALLLCIAMSGAVLANQYFGRRPKLSFGFIGVAVIGSAFILNFWTWDFLPN